MANRALCGVVASLMFAAAGCDRSDIEAVNLANEGDQAKATNLDEAISKFEQATTLDPTNDRILWKLAIANQKKEDWAKVALACSKAEKLSPTHANYFFLHGYALRKLAEKGAGASWADARAFLTQAIEKDRNLADAYFELGEVALHLDDEKGAAENYTKAIDAKPDELSFYAPLADLYIRQRNLKEAEQVLKEALHFAKPGDKALFAVHSMLGGVAEARGDLPGAIAEYQAAKSICGQCVDSLRGEQLAYFNLGAAYGGLEPPRKDESIQQLSVFSKVVCRGGLAQRYADQCAQAQEIARKLGGALP